jgi:ABC-type branched-subunit amino acid transport system substrate-binding protein
MKAKTKWLAIFMVLGLILAACGGGDDGTDTTEAPTETTAAPEAPDTTEEMTDTTEGNGEMAPPATDIGVDLDAGTITVGLLSDLTGVFSGLVQPVVTGYEAAVEDINANGGIHGLNIVLDIKDTVYSVDTHVQLYNEMKDSVVAIGHSTGSPHTVAIAPQLAEDNVFAVPLTWYSGWSDPALNANIVPHGTPYCIEAMNTLGYMMSELTPDATTIAIASNAGDFGEDSAEGAKLAAEALGLEIVYDGQGKVNAADEATLAEVANGIIGATPDVVWLTTSPGAYSGIYGQTLAAGLAAKWSGSFVAWNFGFLGAESPIRDAVQRDWIFGYPIAHWSADNEGTASAREVVQAYDPEAPAYEYYLEGVVEARLMETILNAAYDSGDMTRAGVLAAAKNLETMDWNGLAPTQSFTGSPNDSVQRLSNIVMPSAADLEAGGSGLALLAEDYTSDIAAAFEFNEACFDAGFGG